MWTKVLDVELHASEAPEWSPGGPKSTLDAPSVQHELLALAGPDPPGGHHEARVSLTMPVTVGIHGDESMVAQAAASGYMQLRWRVVVQGPRC